MNLLDLPDDIFVLIFPYLDAADFLSLTGTTPLLRQYCTYNPYWSYLTRSTFRLPPQPALHATSYDGSWQRLYRTLRTQSRVFTWGNDYHGNLGHWGRKRVTSRSIRTHRRSTGWPGRMKDLEDVGIVSDVQCGGWSTVLLNASGQLWAVGTLNGQRGQPNLLALEPLKFPPAYPQTNKVRCDPSTAISQFSVGRELVLGLSDDRKIWEWVDFNRPAQMIKFLHLHVGDGSAGSSKVMNVVAGWGACSAFVAGKGIVYWEERPSYHASEEVDTLLVDHDVVPQTYQSLMDDNAPSIGRVTKYVFLEHYIVFATEDNRVYAWKAVSKPLPGVHPKELVSFHKTGSKIQDLQGSFRRFGVFTDTGDVLTGDQDLLDRVWGSHEASSEAEPTTLPALQRAGVISLAFGDWHFHALHSDGTITSHGHEPQGCGALGLGSRNVSPLRGLYFPHRPGGDGFLQLPSWSDGRRTIWFEEEKERWLSDTCQRGATSEAKPRVDMVANNSEAAGMMGEWFEREGQNWGDGPSRLPARMEKEEAGGEMMGAYRALKIAAAGWSSAALVLVDGERAETIRKQYRMADPSEEVPEAPDQPQSAGGFLQSVANLGRSLFGIAGQPESGPDEAPSATQPLPHRQAALDSRRNHLASPSDVDTDIYVWDDQPYPRLRYPDGRTMPGDVPITPWRGEGEQLQLGGEISLV